MDESAGALIVGASLEHVYDIEPTYRLNRKVRRGRCLVSNFQPPISQGYR
jgi:hypothetical protein